MATSRETLEYALGHDIPGGADNLIRCRIEMLYIAGNIAPTVGLVAGTLSTIGMSISAFGVLPSDVDTGVKITSAVLSATAAACVRIKQTYRGSIQEAQENLVELYRAKGIQIEIKGKNNSPVAAA